MLKVLQCSEKFSVAIFRVNGFGRGLIALL
jgi:hypothetical protein